MADLVNPDENKNSIALDFTSIPYSHEQLNVDNDPILPDMFQHPCTLDEAISLTILRDAKAIVKKFSCVLFFREDPSFLMDCIFIFFAKLRGFMGPNDTFH
ncbi:hypothetical protein HZS_5371, partial [Henneguya salminicola]